MNHKFKTITNMTTLVKIPHYCRDNSCFMSPETFRNTVTPPPFLVVLFKTLFQNLYNVQKSSVLDSKKNIWFIVF